ncbi:hypothetical protein [Mucilaginibacter sp.]
MTISALFVKLSPDNSELVSASLRTSIPLLWTHNYLNVFSASGMLKQVQHDKEMAISAKKILPNTCGDNTNRR